MLQILCHKGSVSVKYNDDQDKSVPVNVVILRLTNSAITDQMRSVIPGAFSGSKSSLRT